MKNFVKPLSQCEGCESEYVSPAPASGSAYMEVPLRVTVNFDGDDNLLEWEAVSPNIVLQESKYIVLRDGDVLVELPASATNYLDESAEPDTSYTYSVRYSSY